MRRRGRFCGCWPACLQVAWWWWLIALVIRRVMFGEDDSPGQTPGFTLRDLRQMHESGELSDEEWQAVKDRLLAQSKAEVADQAPLPEQKSEPQSSVQADLQNLSPEPEGRDAADPPTDVPPSGEGGDKTVDPERQGPTDAEDDDRRDPPSPGQI